MIAALALLVGCAGNNAVQQAATAPVAVEERQVEVVPPQDTTLVQSLKPNATERTHILTPFQEQEMRTQANQLGKVIQHSGTRPTETR